ncbi:diguanylate cyclase [Cryobacterium levicorallinum]|uniref:Diguanylate cyclase n=1 Tax=Cryobacterium levicorallinum TaxID=995038 RepID=A0A1I3B5Y7_9MICO|nr:diguanylate cyclase [Cryobacterium levicorallinum]TFB83436.1 diguanylate cyclase [Cryobacterium levicorallinum]GEP26956.1 hypothetical protein CLE01_15540 [Cryobacterium levicorallinum]SFH57717.1 serine/threonine-protein kinase RsbW [Cryobacterium levicorallinum]
MTDSFEDLYDQAPCGYLCTTPDGVVTTVNETFLTWTKYSRDDLLGKPFKLLVAPDSSIFYETRYLPILQLGGTVREVALTVRCADGTTLPILINSTTRFAADGTPLLVRTAIFDATQRHDLERQLLSARRVAESSEAAVRVLQDASTAFGACTTEQSLAETLVSRSLMAFRATSAAVMLPDESGTLRVVAGTHALDSLLPQFGPCPESDVLVGGEFVAISSRVEAARLYPGLEDAMRSSRIEALSIEPLRSGPLILGVLICLYGRKRVFDGPVRELHEALARQATQVLERVRLQEKLRLLAHYDHLTGLVNRELLHQTLERVFEAAARRFNTMAVIFFDLDGFKVVNDQLGHAAGDSVLIEVAGRLRSAVRDVDTVARFGGDEFVVVCAKVDPDAAQGLAERIRLAVQHPLTGVAVGFRVTASIGLVVCHLDPGSELTTASILRMADAAMYMSKRSGKDQVTTLRAGEPAAG